MQAITQLPYLTHEVRNNLKPEALVGLSSKMIDQHWMLYKGYVTNVNLLHKLISDCVGSEKELNDPRMAEIQRRLGFEYNGMILHESYFGELKKEVPLPTSNSELVTQLSDNFGSLAQWKKQFTEIGKMRGIGWVLTSFDPSSDRLINLWITDHEIGHIAGFIPIVVMDVWEHAYVGDFGPNTDGRAHYIDAFFQNLNWEVVAERLTRAKRSAVLPSSPV